MKNIYCISGLGADFRVFQKLDLPGYTLVPVRWAEFDRHDDMGCYAQKIRAQMPDEQPIIIGVSFGGMLASEISSQYETGKVFAVSAPKSSSELPPAGKFLQAVVHLNLMPVRLATMFPGGIYEAFGAKTQEEKDLLYGILKDSDPAFVRWSMRAVVDWQSRAPARNVVQIMGDADRIIDPSRIHADYVIHNGPHLMIYSRAAEISRIIEKELLA